MCGKFKFHNDIPMLKYCQKSLNSSCFGSLASAFASIKETKAENSIPLHIEESLKIKVGNRMHKDTRKKAIPRKPVYLTDSDYDYILE